MENPASSAALLAVGGPTGHSFQPEYRYFLSYGCTRSFLVLLSLYFARFSEKIHIQATVANGFLMGLVAGIGNGFFGIGGPPVALYLFAAATEKKSYLATIQAYFLFCNLHSILVRNLHGSLLVSHIPIILVGWVSIAIGTIAGLKLFTKIPEYFLKRIVYAFVGLSGLWIALQQLF